MDILAMDILNINFPHFHASRNCPTVEISPSLSEDFKQLLILQIDKLHILNEN